VFDEIEVVDALDRMNRRRRILRLVDLPILARENRRRGLGPAPLVAVPTKPVFLGREVDLKRTPAINDPDQTTGFDHGGIHPQLGLPPFLRSSLPGMRD